MIVVNVEPSPIYVVLVWIHTCILGIALLLVGVPFQSWLCEIALHEGYRLNKHFVGTNLIQNWSPYIIGCICLDDKDLIVVRSFGLLPVQRNCSVWVIANETRTNDDSFQKALHALPRDRWWDCLYVRPTPFIYSELILLTLVSKERDFMNSKHWILKLQEHVLLEAPADNELDPFEQFVTK